MAGRFSTTHKRVSSNAGKAASQKKDGYAKGPVPEAAIGAKPGKVDGHPYSGPEISIPERGF